MDRAAQRVAAAHGGGTARIKADVRAQRLDASSYALLYDRLKIWTGEKQRYGSQIAQGEKGRLIVLALEDRAKVDAFRKELGLVPLELYLTYLPRAKPDATIEFEE